RSLVAHGHTARAVPVADPRPRGLFARVPQPTPADRPLRGRRGLASGVSGPAARATGPCSPAAHRPGPAPRECLLALERAVAAGGRVADRRRGAHLSAGPALRAPPPAGGECARRTRVSRRPGTRPAPWPGLTLALHPASGQGAAV